MQVCVADDTDGETDTRGEGKRNSTSTLFPVKVLNCLGTKLLATTATSLSKTCSRRSLSYCCLCCYHKVRVLQTLWNSARVVPCSLLSRSDFLLNCYFMFSLVSSTGRINTLILFEKFSCSKESKIQKHDTIFGFLECSCQTGHIAFKAGQLLCFSFVMNPCTVTWHSLLLFQTLLSSWKIWNVFCPVGKSDQ